MHPALVSLAEEFRATCTRLLAYMGGLAAIAIVATELFRALPVVAAAGPAALPQWIAVDRPNPAFAVTISELADVEAGYAILRHAAGGRKDIMTWGDASSAAPFARIEIYRPGFERDAGTDIARTIAARVADLAGVRTVTPAGTLDSKLGPFALVDFTIAKGSERRRCLGFMRAFDETAMQISGWTCNDGLEVVERGIIACALDRLMLLSAGGDSRLADLFARAERKRTVCGLKSTHIAATPRRQDWIAGTAATALRGRFVAR